MAGNDRKIPSPDRNLLWAATQGFCEFPNCGVPLVAHGGTKYVTVGEIAHIFAHSGGGPRFNASLDETWVDSYDNWLLMCRKHHRIVDNDEESFPAEMLANWKADRDKRFLQNSNPSSFTHLASPPPIAQHFQLRTALYEKLTRAISTNRAVLIGLAGSGKTQLAVHYFAAQEERYTFRWWIRGHTLESIENDLASLAPLLAVSPPKEVDIQATAKLVVAEISNRSDWLIVFDAVPWADIPPSYIPTGGDVLVTSQANGWSNFEKVTCGDMSQEESIALLRRRVDALDNDPDELNQLAHLCGYHPLTIVHTSGYMSSRSLSVKRAIELLDRRRFEVISRGGGEAPNTLVTALELTQKELSTEGLTLAHTLAALAPSPFPIVEEYQTPEGISPLWGDELAIEDAVAELLRFSLIERRDEELSMHGLVQHIIWSAMTEEIRLASIHNAIFQIVQQIPVETITSTNRPRFERVLPHAQHVISLLESSHAHSSITAFLLNRVGSYYGDRHETPQGKALLQQGLDTLTEAELENGQIDDDAWTTKASLLHNLGNAEYDRGDAPRAESLVRQALAIKLQHAPNDDRLIAYSENFLGTICHAKGEVQEARILLTSALRRFRATGVMVRTAGCLVDLAQLELDEGHAIRAREALDEARLLAEQDPEASDQKVRIYSMLAIIQVSDGNVLEAFRLARGAVDITRATGADDIDLVRALTTQGTILFEARNIVRARKVLREAQDILNDSTQPPTIEESRARGNLGKALFLTGDIDCGFEEMQRSLDDLTGILPAGHPTLQIAEEMLVEADALNTKMQNSFDDLAALVNSQLDTSSRPVYDG